LPEEIRVIRVIDETQVRSIVNFIDVNNGNYVIPPLLATVDQPVTFEELKGLKQQSEFGLLSVPMSAQLVLSYGQNYRAALIEVLRQHSEMGNDTVPVMLIVDENFISNNKIYSALNTKSFPTRLNKKQSSIQDDNVSKLVLELINEVSLFSGLTEMEKTTLSHRTNKLFTYSIVYQANRALLGMSKRTKTSNIEKSMAIDYWESLAQIIPEWSQVVKREVQPSELRKNYIHAHGMALISLGNLGNQLIKTYPDDWKERLKNLSEIDWQRTNPVWQKRAMERGRMSKARHNLILTSNYLKQFLGLPLSEGEQKIETEI